MPSVTKFRKFFVKLFNWEYWPFSVVYFPVYFYYIWLALKCRSFFFFSASNPSIDFGGMFGEKKSEIFDIIPEKYIPKTSLVRMADISQALDMGKQIGFPLIAKPDIGERGAWVKKIADEKELRSYAERCPVDFLLQELVDLPIELGVFFVRYPGKAGEVTSIVRKEFLQVVGDGTHTVSELLKGNPRAVITADLSSEFLRNEGDRIPEKGERILVEPIGNHCRGTKFLNDKHEIDGDLHEAFNKLADEIPGFYFGRFDLKCQSFEELKDLKNFKILELNGAGSEPGHIYQPGYSLLRAYKDIFWHLGVLADISAHNHRAGVPYWSFKRGYRKWSDHRAYNRLLDTE